MFPEAYIQTLIDGTQTVRALLPDLEHAAEAAAGRLISGGDLYIASVRPDFVSEGYIRSGGLMMLREYDPADPPKPRDVVIFGWTGVNGEADLALLTEIQATGALIIGIGPDMHELVAALTRQNRMPVLFQSVLVPGARDRNASFGTKRFHPSHTVPSLSPGQLASVYLDGISSCLCSLLSESNALTEAAETCSKVLAGGHRIHAFLISHFPIHQAGAPGDPGHMTPLEVITGETPDTDELDQKLTSGDLFFFLGYYRRPRQAYELARSRGCQIVEVVTGDNTPTTGPLPEHVITPGWHYTDALVEVPGYDIRILPASGILQSTVYWSIVGRITKLSS
jgi:hypothetical protein